MRIQPNDKKIRSFTKYYWQAGRKVLYQNSRRVVELIGKVPIEEVKARAANILNTPEMRDYLTHLWATTGSWFAQDMSSRIMTRQKDDMWYQSYLLYLESRVGAKAASIARTQAGLINSVIDLVVQEGFAEGLSIDEISSRLVYELDKKLKIVHNWEAERIARTEVIGAANKGSFDAAMAAGNNLQKGWLTSGLKGTRDSHQLYESMGFVPMDYSYNIGLKHPGDPNGSPEEIINCRCTIVYSTID